MKIHLLTIDPQNDFCDPKGALSVTGANKDMERLATMIDRIGHKLDNIIVSLDSHQLIHIAHPIFWRNSAGNRPDPFTIISADDVRNGKWIPAKPSLLGRALKYVEQLEKNARYPLCIWPPHCLIGSWGAAVYPVFFEAVMKWCDKEYGLVDWITKGSNPLTEHYSAIRADVEDPKDSGTWPNSTLLTTLMEADVVPFSGEASSHCVANTVRDICDLVKKQTNDDSFVNKLVYLKNGSSPVPSFEHLADDFEKEMVGRGMKISTTEDFLS